MFELFEEAETRPLFVVTMAIFEREGLMVRAAKYNERYAYLHLQLLRLSMSSYSANHGFVAVTIAQQCHP